MDVYFAVVFDYGTTFTGVTWAFKAHTIDTSVAFGFDTTYGFDFTLDDQVAPLPPIKSSQQLCLLGVTEQWCYQPLYCLHSSGLSQTTCYFRLANTSSGLWWYLEFSGTLLTSSLDRTLTKNFQGDRSPQERSYPQTPRHYGPLIWNWYNNLEQTAAS